MRYHFWQIVDAVAHWLYAPGMLGRRIAVARRWHEIHLIPGSWLAWVCDRLDAASGLTREEMCRR